MLEHFLHACWRFRLYVSLAALLVGLCAVYAATHLSLNDSPERWMPQSTLDAWRRLGQHFEYGDTIAIGIRFDRPIEDEDATWIANLRTEVIAIEGVNRVIDISLLANQVEQVPITKMIAEPADRSNDPFSMYRGILFDDPKAWFDGKPEDAPTRTVLMVVELKSSMRDGWAQPEKKDELDQRRRVAVAALYEKLDKYAQENVTFYPVGATIIQFELEAIARRAILTFIPCSLVLTLLAIGIGFRSSAALLIAIAGGIWSMVVMLAGVAFMGWTLNVITIGGPTLMAVITVATTVHVAHYYAIHQNSDPLHFIRWVAVPCLGAAVATGVGFLMLSFNELNPAKELGVELFVGANLAFLGVFIAWLVLAPFRAAEGRTLSAGNLSRLLQAMVVRPRFTIVAFVVLVAVLLFFTSKVQINPDPFSFFKEDAPIAKALRHFENRNIGYYTLDVILVPKKETASSDDGKRTPSDIVEDRVIANQFVKAVEVRTEVRDTISAIDLTRRMQHFNLLRMLLFKDTFKSWMVDLKGEHAIRITFMTSDKGEGFVPFLQHVRTHLPHERFECFYTGTTSNVVILSEGLVGGIGRGLFTAFIVMTILCLALFGSLRLTLIAFLPNAFPILVVFGLMGMLNIPLDAGSAMVATIALGVALNDTVHFMLHYKRCRADGAGVHDALSHTVQEIGRPIVLTSLVNCAGFAIFVLAEFQPIYHFGMLASVAMLAALVGDLLLLPNLLWVFDKRES